MNKGVAPLILRTLPIFSGLNEHRLAALALEATLKSVVRNEVVLREGDTTDHVYFVLNGGLKVLVTDDEGREVILSMLGTGDVFGELSVLDDHPRSATVTAVETSKLVVFTKQDFLRCLEENFDIALLIMQGMAARLRMADQRIESLALLDVYGRVARLLLELSEPVGGVPVVTRRLSKQDIAKMVGASREMVSRVMKDLAQHGLIDERDDGIHLIGEKVVPAK